MRGSRPTTAGDVPLRDRLERLDGLPMRPSTVRLMLGVASDRGAMRPDRRDDPGLALLVDSRGDRAALASLPDLPWWAPCEGPAAGARDRLWRFAAATATAARRLALSAGDPDPEAVARLGLLHPIALWALAAIDPSRLALWMAAEDEEERRRLERDWFGREAIGLGLHLARRWGCGASVLDAVLLSGTRGPIPAGVASDPDRLDLVRCARRWAMRTPWALPGPLPDDGPTEDQRRWLVATVQARCAVGLVLPDDPAEGPGIFRKLARQALRDERAEEELSDLMRRLGAALQALDHDRAEVVGKRAADVLDAMVEFAAGAAHELNNPLAIIAGRAQLLQGRLADPEHRQALQTIIGQARRAHQILRDLIYIARPPSPRRVPCVPDQVLQAVVNDLESEARSRQIRLSCRVDRPTVAASTDPEALRHLADALIRNALEATQPGGEVVVESVGRGRSLVWTVRDDGIGLDPERAAHLLDPFYCGRQAGRGLGLGLPRVARYVRSAGGRIEWQEAPGGGAIARVELPLDAEDVAATARTPRLDLKDAG